MTHSRPVWSGWPARTSCSSGTKSNSIHLPPSPFTMPFGPQDLAVVAGVQGREDPSMSAWANTWGLCPGGEHRRRGDDGGRSSWDRRTRGHGDARVHRDRWWSSCLVVVMVMIVMVFVLLMRMLVVCGDACRARLIGGVLGARIFQQSSARDTFQWPPGWSCRPAGPGVVRMAASAFFSAAWPRRPPAFPGSSSGSEDDGAGGLDLVVVELASSSCRPSPWWRPPR